MYIPKACIKYIPPFLVSYLKLQTQNQVKFSGLLSSDFNVVTLLCQSWTFSENKVQMARLSHQFPSTSHSAYRQVHFTSRNH